MEKYTGISLVYTGSGIHDVYLVKENGTREFYSEAFCQESLDEIVQHLEKLIEDNNSEK